MNTMMDFKSGDAKIKLFEMTAVAGKSRVLLIPCRVRAAVTACAAWGPGRAGPRSYWRGSLHLELRNRHADLAELLDERVDGLLMLLVGHARLVPILFHPAELDVYRGIRDGAVLVVLLEDRVEREDLILDLKKCLFSMLL